MTIINFIGDVIAMIWLFVTLIAGLSLLGCILVYLIKDEVDYQIWKRKKK